MQLPRVTALLPLVLVTALAGCTGHHGMMGSGPSSGTAGAGASSAARLAAQDLAFATTAAGSGMYEVEISRIAAGKASNAAVRNYAQMLVSHHTMAKASARWPTPT